MQSFNKCAYERVYITDLIDNSETKICIIEYYFIISISPSLFFISISESAKMSMLE